MMARIVGSSAADGKSGAANRRNPKRPHLQHDAARMTEPAVGASTCASGNHV